MTSPRERAFQVFLATVALGILVTSFIALWIYYYPERKFKGVQGTVEVVIPKGSAAPKVAQLLTEAKLINHPNFFRLYASHRGDANRFRPGTYQFTAPITPRVLVDLLVKGVADVLVTVTIPEGKHLLDVVEIISAAGIAPKKELLALATDASFAKSLNIRGQSLEGYLFPDTYRLRPKSDPAEVLAILVKRHHRVFEEIRARNPTGLGFLRTKLKMDDPRIVTLASIVEKETGQPAERPHIAQVFLNRLLKSTFKPKLLQTDPTIIYGCTVAPLYLGHISSACKKWDGRIRRIHLDDPDNPYNTYTHEGLPPGPIANPGRAALTAVLHPDGSEHLYFVSKNDGTHYFSATVAEHEAAVVKYQRGGKPMDKP